MTRTLFPIFILAGQVMLLSGAERPPIGWDAVCRLDLLPVLRETAKVGMVSSYDRTGGNDDGFSGKYSFIRKDAEGLILADLKGPGVIYRIWTPTPSDDTLEFLFDGETQPRLAVKFRDLFLGKHSDFPPPLVGFGAGGYYSYVPISFAKSCVVRMRAAKVQFYQINFSVYPPDTALSTFQPGGHPREKVERARALFAAAGSDVSREAAGADARVESSVSKVSLTSGRTQTVFSADRPGRIVGLRVWPAEALVSKARDLLLRISFDGEPPAVLCPFGDFFGYAWGQPAMRSLLLGTAGATNFSYFPMPFDRGARVEVVSERALPVDFQVEVMHTRDGRRPGEGRFYALWRRENPTTAGKPFVFFETKGAGHLAGVVLQAQGFESGKTLFFEGDDQTTVDGELAIHGTGSEDFFNGGWYDVPDRWEKRLSFPLSGCLGYAKHLGRTGAYRLFLGDAYSYRQSLLQTIEHSGERNNIPTDHCSVSYLYSKERPSFSIEVPPLPGRAVADLKEVVFPAFWQTPIYAWSFERASLTRKKEKIQDEEVRYLSLSATGGDWFGPHFLSPTIEVPRPGEYSIHIEVVKGPGAAVVQLFQNENPAGDPVDLYAEEIVRSQRLFLGKLRLEEGRNNLMIKLVGKNEKSSGLSLDLIQIACVQAD